MLNLDRTIRRFIVITTIDLTIFESNQRNAIDKFIDCKCKLCEETNSYWNAVFQDGE